MPLPPPSPPKARSGVEDLQMKADAITDDSLSSARRMKAMCDEAKEAGLQTLGNLDYQGEKLENIEKGMGKINADMKEADKNLKGMGSFLGGIHLGKSSGKDKDKAKQKKKKDDGSSGSAGGANPRVGVSEDGIPTYGGFVAKYTNDAREDEMNETLGDVSNMVANLRNMAIDMGSEITDQNSQLDRINLMADENVGRITDANQKTGKLLK